MKKKQGLIFAVLMCFIAVNGFSLGLKEMKANIKEANEGIAELKKAKPDSTSNTDIADLKKKQDEMDRKLDQLLARNGDNNPPKITPSKNIEGRGSLNKAGVISYIKLKNSAAKDVEELINFYFDIAAEENINHEIAIAQMLHATDSLRNGRVSTRNYAGLNHEGTRPRWDGTFRNMREGVMAHIQHLKGYASTTPPKGTIVDPRYELLGAKKGTIKNFDQLYQTWVHGDSSAYKQKIETILNDLYKL